MKRRWRERTSSAPTNWVPIPGQDKNREAMANILCMASARTRSSSPRRPGRVERGQPFVGQSLIVGYTGWPIAGPASPRRKASIGDRIAAPPLGFPVGAPGAAPNGHLALMHSRSCRAILGALGIVPRRART